MISSFQNENLPHSGPILGNNIHKKHQGCFRERELSTKHFFFNCGFVHLLEETSVATSPRKKKIEVGQCEKMSRI